MSQQETFGLEVSRGFAAKLVLAIVGFLGSIIFARYLGPVKYGAFHVIVAAANILDNPIEGFGEACKKRISESKDGNNEIVGAGLLLSIIGGGLIALCAVAVGSYLNLAGVEKGYYYTGIILLGFSIFKILQPMIDGVGEFGTSVILDALRSVFTIPLQLVFVFLGWGVAGMVYGLTIASLMTAPVCLRILGIRPEIPSKDTLQSLWSFARSSIPNKFVGAAYSRVDILILGSILGSGASGQYQIAYQLVLPGAFLAMVMGSGLFTEVSSQVSENESPESRVTNNIAFASIFAIPMFFGAVAMPEDIVVTIFGPEYRPASTLLIGLAIFQVLSTQTGQISAIISGYDHPDLNLKITIITLTTNLAFGLILVFQIGMLGVVIATVIAEGTKYLLVNFYARKYVSYSLIPKPMRHQFLAGFLMYLVVRVIHHWVGVQSIFDLLGLVGIGAIVYGLLFAFLSNTFLVTIRGIILDAINKYS